MAGGFLEDMSEMQDDIDEGRGNFEDDETLDEDNWTDGVKPEENYEISLIDTLKLHWQYGILRFFRTIFGEDGTADKGYFLAERKRLVAKRRRKRDNSPGASTRMGGYDY